MGVIRKMLFKTCEKWKYTLFELEREISPLGINYLFELEGDFLGKNAVLARPSLLFELERDSN